MTERDRQRRELPLYGQQQDDDLREVPTSGLLVDSYGRRIKNLRISVTDKCNFRCTYCMPAEGLPWLPKTEILSYEEITRIARVAVHLGIEQIRLTGGESLVRRNLPELVCQLRTIEGLEEIKHFR